MQPNDTVAITFEDLPLKFYFKEHKIYGGLTGEELTHAPKADWIIIRRNIITSADHKVYEYITQHVDGSQYEPVVLYDTPDTPYENRESPDEHYYATAMGFEPLVLFKKKKLP